MENVAVKEIEPVTYLGKLSYQILTEECLEGGSDKFPVYGLRVSYHCAAYDDVDELHGITSDRELIERLKYLLSDNYVTPVAFRDVVRDFLDDRDYVDPSYALRLC